jgi:probable HAF family extracellular repeat protein
LGTLPGDSTRLTSTASAINNAGQVVGWSERAGGAGHAFLYSGGQMQDLGTLGSDFSDASAINNAGQVVGDSEIASGAEHAFLYSGDTMIDLNTLIDPSSGWTLQYAYGINDLGQIVGDGVINGQGHSFLMTPVPEPVTLLLLAFGGLLLRKRK